MRLWLGAIVAVTMLAAQASFSVADENDDQVNDQAIEEQEESNDEEPNSEESNSEESNKEEKQETNGDSDFSALGNHDQPTGPTGTIKVEKVLDPTNDGGKFRLFVVDEGSANNIGHGESLGPLTVAVGGYTVLETGHGSTDLSDYAAEISCTDGSSGSGTSLADVQVGEDEDIVCTITNTRRATATIEVVKELIEPVDANDRFDLQVNGSTEKNNAKDEDSTGPVEVFVDDSPHSVGETAGNTASLDDYDIEIECRDEGGEGDIVTSGSGASLDDIEVEDGDEIVCVITNTGRSSGDDTGSITIVKETDPEGSEEEFDFTATGMTPDEFSLGDGDDQEFADLDPGEYSVTEGEKEGWTLDDIDCEGHEESDIDADVENGTVTIDLEAGEDITCTFTNIEDENDDPVDTTEVTINKIWIDLDGNEGDEPPGDLPSGFEILLGGGNIDATCSYLGIDLDCNVTDIDGLSDGDEVDVDEADMPEGWARSEDPVIASCEEDQNQTGGTDTDCIITVVNVEEAVLGGDTGNGNGDQVLGTVTSRGGARGDSLALTGASLVTMLLFALALMAGGTLSRRLGRRRGDEV